MSYDLTSAFRVGRRSFKLFLTDNYAKKTISCLPGLLLRDGCLTAAREGDYASLLFENFCDYLSEYGFVTRKHILTKSTFFKIIIELLLVSPLFCLIRGCSRHWVGNLCLGFHRGIQGWSRFSLCLSFVTCVTWNTQAAGQLGNLKNHLKNCKTDEYFRSAVLVLKGFCR